MVPTDPRPPPCWVPPGDPGPPEWGDQRGWQIGAPEPEQGAGALGCERLCKHMRQTTGVCECVRVNECVSVQWYVKDDGCASVCEQM